MDISELRALDAETAVVGSMLIDSDVVPKVLSELDGSEFSSEGPRQLFGAMRSMFRSGEQVDPIAVVARLGWWDDKEMRGYVAGVMDATPTSANAMEYCRILREQATLRTIRAQAATLAEAHTLEDCREAVAALTDAFGSGRQVEAWTMREMLRDFGDRKSNNSSHEYIMTGIAAIDSNIYLERGDVMMIGGAPSDGKTALGIQIAIHMAAKYNVGFYSLETSAAKLADRIVANHFRIEFGRIKRAKLTDADWKVFAEGSSEAEKRQLTVVRAGGMTVDQIAASAKARGFDAIFVDYVQLIDPPARKNASRAEQMAEVSRALHTFAQSSNTLVVELAQLTRQGKDNQRDRTMFDFSESSQFEKDSDLVLLVYRPPEGTKLIDGDEDSPELDANRHRILRVAKNKEGKRTRLAMAFDGDHQRFSVIREMAYEAAKSAKRVGEKIKGKKSKEPEPEAPPDGEQRYIEAGEIPW